MEIREHTNGKHACITLVPESAEEFEILHRFVLAFEANRDGYIDVQRVEDGLHIDLVEPQ